MLLSLSFMNLKLFLPHVESDDLVCLQLFGNFGKVVSKLNVNQLLICLFVLLQSNQPQDLILFYSSKSGPSILTPLFQLLSSLSPSIPQEKFIQLFDNFFGSFQKLFIQVFTKLSDRGYPLDNIFQFFISIAFFCNQSQKETLKSSFDLILREKNSSSALTKQLASVLQIQL